MRNADPWKDMRGGTGIVSCIKSVEERRIISGCVEEGIRLCMNVVL